MYYNRYLDDKLTDEKSAGKVKLLLGARQSGKSTLLKHCLSGRSGVMSINLQDRRVRIKYERDKESFLQELAAADNISTVFIDEIQKVPGLFDDVQYFFDNDCRRFDFFLTGSSGRRLKVQSSNMLPGRTHIFYMTPVLQAEQRDSEILPLRMKTGKPFPLRLLEDILVYGNLPGLYAEKRDSWCQTITAYTELYIENEIRKENIVNDIGGFLMFLKLAALESGQTVNYTKIANAVGVSVNTVRNYYQVLEDTYVGLRIPSFGRSRKKTISAPRFLIFDLGVRNALAGLPMSEALVQLDSGRLFEQFVMIELFYRCQLHGRTHRLSTWRTTTGAEVDAVVETPDEVIPVEIKWTDSPRHNDIRHLETFLALHGDIASRGYLICRVDIPRKLSERIVAIPWSRF
ncbi:MAG: ATP-binding protein [Victivallales bacterium]|nr:ATP-binding protein [Victivallales bacterium]